MFQVDHPIDAAGNVAVTEKHTWELDATSGFRVTDTETESEKISISEGCDSPPPLWNVLGGTKRTVSDAAKGDGVDPAVECMRFQPGDGRLAEIAGNCGCNTASFAWNADKNKRQIETVTDTLGRWTTTSYDAFGRKTGITLFDDDTTSTNESGTGLKSWYTYAGISDLIASVEQKSVRAGASRASIAFTRNVDLNGKIVSPIVTQITRTGQTATDIAAIWSNPSNGWGSQTQTTTITPVLSAGAITQRTIDGPMSGTSDQVVEIYYASTDTSIPPNSLGRLHELRQYYDSTHYLSTTFGDSTACGTSPAPGYDVFGHPLTVTDPNGNTRCYSYDSHGRLTNVRRGVSGAGPGITLTYGVNGEVATAVDEDGTMTKSIYEGGFVAGSSAGLVSAVERWSASSGGTLLSRKELSYFGTAAAAYNRNLLSRVRTLARVPTVGMTCMGNSECAGDSSATCSAGVCAVTSCTSDSQCSTTGTAACLQGICYQVQSVLEYGYDTERRLSEVRVFRTSGNDPNARMQTTRDAAGQVTANTVKNGSGTTTVDDLVYVLDSQGRPSELKKRVGGNLMKMASYTYDAHGKVATTTFFDSSEIQLSQTVTAYDDFGRLVYVSSPDLGKTAYVYDAAGNEAARRDGNGLETSRSYDGLSRLTLINYLHDTDTTYTYDETTSPTLTDCRTNASIAAVTRNGIGRLTKVVDDSSTHYFNYDDVGRRVSAYEVRTRASESCARVTTWTYDTAGRLTDMRYPTGRQLKFVYSTATTDDRASPTKVQASINGTYEDVITDLVFGASSELRRLKYANGIQAQYDWFLDGTARTRIHRDGSTVVFKRDVTDSDEFGNPLTVASHASGLTEAFQYDADFHALTQASISSYSGLSPYALEDYSYDPLVGTGSSHRQSLFNDRGSRIRHLAGTEFTAQTTLKANSSRIDTIVENYGTMTIPDRKWTYTYDDNGATTAINQFKKSGTTWDADDGYMMQYDDQGRLKTVRSQYFYDYRNLRTRTYSFFNAAEALYYYSDDGLLLSEIGCDASTCDWPRIVRDYIYINGDPVAMIQAKIGGDASNARVGPESDSTAAVYAIESGLLSEPRRLTNSSKAEVWYSNSAPFGRSLASNSSDQSTFPFWLGLPGQYFDNDIGVSYNWHRTYDATTGSYWQADPLTRTKIGADFHLSPYNYATGIPTAMIDPTGLFTFGFSAFGLVGGGGSITFADGHASFCAEAGTGIGISIRAGFGDSAVTQATQAVVFRAGASIFGLTGASIEAKQVVDGDASWAGNFNVGPVQFSRGSNHKRTCGVGLGPDAYPWPAPLRPDKKEPKAIAFQGKAVYSVCVPMW